MKTVKKKAEKRYKNDEEKFQAFWKEVVPRIQEMHSKGQLGPEVPEFKSRIWIDEYNMFSSVYAHEMWTTGILTVDINDKQAVRICFEKAAAINTENNREYRKGDNKQETTPEPMDNVSEEKQNPEFIENTSVTPADTSDVKNLEENVKNNVQQPKTTEETKQGKDVAEIINSNFKKGDELYCPPYGVVKFDGLQRGKTRKIKFVCEVTKESFVLNTDGKLSNAPGAQLMIYPDESTYRSSKHWTWKKYRTYTLLNNPELVCCFSIKKGKAFLGVLLAVDDKTGKYYIHDVIPKCPKTRAKAHNFIDSGNCMVYDKDSVMNCDEIINQTTTYNKFLKHLWDGKTEKTEKLPQTNLFKNVNI